MSPLRLTPPILFSATLGKIAFALLLALVLLVSRQSMVQHAHAAPMGSITVNTPNDDITTDGFCSLREAITNANDDAATHPDCATGSGTDTINFSGVTLLNIATELAITSDITFNGTGITVDNTGTGRVFLITNATVIINGMTITGGADNTGVGGGGIRVSGGSLTLQNGAVVTGNTVIGGGGGVYALSNAQVTITGSGTQISGNTGTTNGAGLNLQNGADAFLLNGAVISNNSGPNSGGGVAVAGTGSSFTVDNATVSDNTAQNGAGGIIAFSGGSVILQNGAIISENIATAGHGGGVIISTGADGLSVSDTRFEGNTASANGDAIYYTITANATITNSCFINNGDTAISNINTGLITAHANWWGTSWGPQIVAAGGGSAISNGDSISGNGVTGVDVGLTSAGAADGSSIPSGNWLTSAPTVAGSACATVLPTVTIAPAAFNVNEGDNADFMLTRTGSTTSDLVVSVDITLGTGAVEADYTLSGGAISGQSGNQTITIPAGQASVMVNLAATDDVDAEANNSVTMTLVDDVDYNLGVATASTATIPANDTVVTNSNNSGDGSLRQAITNANAFVGDDTITFTISSMTILLNSEINIATNMTVDGSVSDITLSGGNTTRILNITDNPTVTLDGLTLTNGNSASENGGAILASATSTLNVANCTFTNNTGFQGGAIFTTGGLNVSDSSFSGNSASLLGSAIRVDDGAPSPTITNSAFTDNTNGIYAVWFNLVAGTASISNSVFSGNSGGFGGSGTINFTNNTFTNNNSSNGGGALYLGSGTHTIINNTISGNHSAQSGAAGGIYAQGDGTYGNANVILRNTILANNTHSTAPDCRAGSLSSITVNNSLIEDPSNCTFSGNNNITSQDPDLGSFTGVVIPLNPGSPAIDTADATYCPATDQRDESRTADLACDMGAYEMQYADNNTVIRPASSSALTTFGPTLVGIRRNGGDDPGGITIVKSSTWQTKPDNTIDAYWNITPSSGATYDLTLQLCYLPSELNGLTEADLRFWRYSGGAWSQVGPAPLTWTSINGKRCASVSGVTGFSSWTLGTENTPTAITLTSLTATSSLAAGGWVVWVGALLLVLLLTAFVGHRQRFLRANR